MKKPIYLLAIAAVLYGTAHAAEVVLKWNPAATADGYKVYYRLETETAYRTPMDAGSGTTFTIPFPVPESIGKWYFAVTAYNQYGESGYSGEAGPADITGQELIPAIPQAFVSGKIIFTLKNGQIIQAVFVPASP